MGAQHVREGQTRCRRQFNHILLTEIRRGGVGEGHGEEVHHLGPS